MQTLRSPETGVDLALTGAAIESIQTSDGAIPWATGRHLDPWDHVEAAMGLDAAGRHHAAAAAYRWLARSQRPDGSWGAAYLDGVVFDPAIDSNFCAYVAAGCWHHFLSTSDDAFLLEMWPVIESAIDLVLDMQLPSGAIAWARDADYRMWPEALLTSSSSIFHSLRCAIAIAERVGSARPDWELSLVDLGMAISSEHTDFLPKPTFSMDWYYPVLGGAVRDERAVTRLLDGWETFVVDGKGVRCTSDKPWITTGETCELALACDAVGMDDEARDLFRWVQHLRDVDGLYWTGANHPYGAVYPWEKTTWSAGSVLLAAAVLFDDTPAAGLFRGEGLPEPLPFEDTHWGTVRSK